MNPIRPAWARTAALVACLFVTAAAHAAEPNKLIRYGDAVPGEYIVRLAPSATGDVAAIANAIAKEHGGKARTVWQNALRGFLFVGSDEMAQRVAKDSRVEVVEANARMYPSATRQSTDAPNTQTPAAGNAGWQLSRISHRAAPIPNEYDSGATEKAVRVYVLDSGSCRLTSSSKGIASSRDTTQPPTWDSTATTSAILVSPAAVTTVSIRVTEPRWRP